MSLVLVWCNTFSIANVNSRELFAKWLFQNITKLLNYIGFYFQLRSADHHLADHHQADHHLADHHLADHHQADSDSDDEVNSLFSFCLVPFLSICCCFVLVAASWISTNSLQLWNYSSGTLEQNIPVKCTGGKGRFIQCQIYGKNL